MAVTTTKTNKPILPRGNDNSPLKYNRAALYSGKALDFDGVNDVVTGTASVLPTGANAFTTCFYFNKDADGEAVFWGTRSTNQSNGIGLFSGNKVTHFFFGNDLNSSSNIESGKWYFVAVTFDGTTRSIYINGQFDISDTPTGVNVTGTDYKLGYGGAYYHNGRLANTKVFDVALTAAQVADLYNNPEKVVPTGVADSALKLWLPMQEGAGTTAYDGSGNGNHGTISGATWTHGIGAPVSQTAVIDWNKAKNDIGRSQEFDNGYWSTGNITVTANDTTAPDGTTTADKLVATSTSGSNAEIFRAIGLSTNDSISVFAKYDTAQWVTLGTNRILERTVWFDIQNGVVGTESTGYTGEITEYPNGWYKLDVVIGSGATAQTYWDLSIADADGAIGVTAGKSIFAWGAYANLSGTTIGPYLPNFNSYGITSDVLLPQGLTTGRDITGVNLFENVRKQGALNLDGNSWAEVHDNASLDFSSGMSLEAWVQIDDADGNQHILGKWDYANSGREYLLYYNSASNKFMAMFGHGTSSQTASFPITATGQWFHLVGTTDGSTITPYVNGVAGTTAAQTTALAASDIPVTIGMENTHGVADSSTKGPIAQPRIYNRALTAEEVERNYNAGKNIYK